VAAAGGIEVVAMSFREQGREPAAAATPPRMTGKQAGLDAALGIGPGTGNPSLDGDGLPGLSSPDATRPLFPDARVRPVVPDQNVTRR